MASGRRSSTPSSGQVAPGGRAAAGIGRTTEGVLAPAAPPKPQLGRARPRPSAAGERQALCAKRGAALARRAGVRALGRRASEWLRGCELVYERAQEEERWRKSLCQVMASTGRGAQAHTPRRAPAAWVARAGGAGGIWGEGGGQSQAVPAPPGGPLPRQCPPPELLEDLPAPLAGDGPLRFSSAFESGNLCAAWRSQGSVGDGGDRCEGGAGAAADASYELLIQPDSLSRGHAQWFYFAAALAEGTAPSSGDPAANELGDHADSGRGGVVTARLRLLNFRSSKILYCEGLAPAVWDSRSQRWRYDLCRDVHWGPGPLWKACSLEGEERRHWALSFSFDFKPEDGRIFFAFCHPYTLSFYRSCIARLEAIPGRRELMRRRAIGSSLGGNPIELVEVTEPYPDQEEASEEKQREERDLKELAPASYRRYSRARDAEDGAAHTRRPVVVIMARQHAGEAHGSWIAHGLLEFLTDPSDERACELRQRYCFHVLPMVNPDGVIFGNSRCTLAGHDPNRWWREPSRSSLPEVCALKEHVASLSPGCYMALDLHQHSAKRGIFFYGCQHLGDEPGEAPEDLQLLALLAAKASPVVHWPYCRSSMPFCKLRTARCTLFEELGVRWVYTVEASAFATVEGRDEAAGPSRSGTGAPKLLTPTELVAFGKILGAAVLDLSRLDGDGEGEEEARRRLEEEVAEATERRCPGSLHEAEDSGEGSDACPSDDNLGGQEHEEEMAHIANGKGGAELSELSMASALRQRASALQRPVAPWRPGGRPAARPRPPPGGAHYRLDGEGEAGTPHAWAVPGSPSRAPASWSRPRRISKAKRSGMRGDELADGEVLEALSVRRDSPWRACAEPLAEQYAERQCTPVLAWDGAPLPLKSCGPHVAQPGRPMRSAALASKLASAGPLRAWPAFPELVREGGSATPSLGGGLDPRADRQPSAGPRRVSTPRVLLSSAPPGWQDMGLSTFAPDSGPHKVTPGVLGLGPHPKP